MTEQEARDLQAAVKRVHQGEVNLINASDDATVTQTAEELLEARESRDVEIARILSEETA